jgi:hypothetical protein
MFSWPMLLRKMKNRKSDMNPDKMKMQLIETATPIIPHE